MSLYLFRVLDNDSYDDTVDFEIIPKLVLNDANLIVKVKGDFNVTNKIGSTQHYHVIIAHSYNITHSCNKLILFPKKKVNCKR